jgi:hypothetical protein
MSTAVTECILVTCEGLDRQRVAVVGMRQAAGKQEGGMGSRYCPHLRCKQEGESRRETCHDQLCAAVMNDQGQGLRQSALA